jgi:hypothetical protein
MASGLYADVGKKALIQSFFISGTVHPSDWASSSTRDVRPERSGSNLDEFGLAVR